MTEISRNMAQFAYKIKTAPEAIILLQDNAQFRTFRDIVAAADPLHSSEKELQKKIVDGLCSNHPEKSRESLGKNVRNWFTGKVRNISKETAFEICLILGLNLNDANHFVMRISEEAIHWRDSEEIAWSYAIVHKLSYSQTMQLIAEVKEVCKKNNAYNSSTDIMTHLIRNDVFQCLAGTKEDLLAYIAENSDKLGAFHNTAYELFNKYMQILQLATPAPEEFEHRKQQFAKQKKENKDTDVQMDGIMSAENILETYFFRKCINMDGEMNNLQRSIRMNWPDESMLSKMKRRVDNVDVSRKVLILLFLATNGESSDFQSDMDEYPGERIRRDKVFRDIYTRINRMLIRCGFQTLDPRNPFDWLIIFCICVEDIFDTDRRIEEVLTGLFPNNNETGNENQSE